MPVIHRLKTDWQFYDLVNCGEKTAEIRLNDRNFHRFDFLLLERCHPGIPISHQHFAEITHVLTHKDYPQGLQPGYVMLSLRRCTQEEVNILNYLPETPAPDKK